MTLEEFLAQWNDTSDVIEVHTSGSTGKPKRLLVEKQRMVNSARITCDFLGLKEGDSLVDVLKKGKSYFSTPTVSVNSDNYDLVFTKGNGNHTFITFKPL